MLCQINYLGVSILDDKKPTEVSWARMLYLSFLLLKDPDQFEIEEIIDNERIGYRGSSTKSGRVQKIRKGLKESLKYFAIVFFVSSAAGYLVFIYLELDPAFSTFFVVGGSMVLLWATFAVRGWDIQSNDGITLGERANMWIFRSLYAFGTALIVMGATPSVFIRSSV